MSASVEGKRATPRKSLPLEEYVSRHARLMRIHKLMDSWVRGGPGPRSVFAATAAATVCVVVIVGGVIAAELGRLNLTGSLIWAALTLAAIYLLVYRLAILLSRRPSSWDLALADALAGYDPLRPHWYEALQCKVRAHGFDKRNLTEWLDAEMESLDALSPLSREPDTSVYHAFTERKLPDQS